MTLTLNPTTAHRLDRHRRATDMAGAPLGLPGDSSIPDSTGMRT